MDDSGRFDRIEIKLDRLTDAVTAIARVEEKILASNERVEKLESRITRNEKDLDHVAILARKNSGVILFANKLFWLIIGGGLTIGIYFFKGGGL
jgi:hypothetical protein